MIDHNFPEISRIIVEMLDIKSLLMLYNSIKENESLEPSFNEIFNQFLNKIRTLENEERSDCIRTLIFTIKNSELIKDKYTEILKEFDGLNSELYFISNLIDAIKTEDLKLDYIKATIHVLGKYHYESEFLLTLSKLYKKIKNRDLRKKISNRVLDEFNIIQHPRTKLDYISELINWFSGTELLLEVFFDISNVLIRLEPSKYVKDNPTEYLDVNFLLFMKKKIILIHKKKLM